MSHYKSSIAYSWREGKIKEIKKRWRSICHSFASGMMQVQTYGKIEININKSKEKELNVKYDYYQKMVNKDSFNVVYRDGCHKSSDGTELSLPL